MTGPQHKREKPGPKDLNARELHRAAVTDARRTARTRIFFALLAALLIVGGAVVFSWFSLREPPPQPNVVEVPASTGVSSLIVIENPQREAASIVLVASHPEIADRLELLNPSLLSYVPGYGEFEISELAPLGGGDLIALTITNLLGVRIDAVHVFSEESFLRAVAEPLEVDLAEPLIVGEGDADRVIAAEGEGLRNPEMLYTLLSEPGRGDESSFVLRQSRVWTAILQQVAVDGEFADVFLDSAHPDTILALNGAAQDPDLVVSSLPVKRAEVLGGSLEQYVFDGSETATIVGRSFSYLQLTDEPRISVEILNGNGGVGVTAPIAELLVERGFHVIRTDNADRDDYGETQVVSQGREHQQAAIAIADLIGFGEVVLELRAPSGIFGVTIILGQDISG